MVYGFMGKLLWVDLSQGIIKDEILDEQFCRSYIGGYGFGARISPGPAEARGKSSGSGSNLRICYRDSNRHPHVLRLPLHGSGQVSFDGWLG